ncbi:hypothetical protein [Fulvitalea axinellae]
MKKKAKNKSSSLRRNVVGICAGLSIPFVMYFAWDLRVLSLERQFQKDYKYAIGTVIEKYEGIKGRRHFRYTYTTDKGEKKSQIMTLDACGDDLIQTGGKYVVTYNLQYSGSSILVCSEPLPASFTGKVESDFFPYHTLVNFRGCCVQESKEARAKFETNFLYGFSVIINEVFFGGEIKMKVPN